MSDDAIEEEVWFLFVEWDDSKLRVMFDTRRANMQFHAPPLVRLASE